MRIYEPVAGIEGVASGATPTIQIANNRRLLMVKLYASAMNADPAAVYGADVMDEIQAYVGTKLIRTVTAAELLFFSSFNGLTITPANDGVTLYFVEPKRASVMDEQITAWDLFGSDKVTLKVKVKAGLTAVALTAKQAYDDGFSTNQAGQRVLNIIKQDVSYVNAAAVHDIMNIDVSTPIQRIFLFPESGKAIQAVKAYVDETKIVHDLSATENRSFLKDYGLVSEVGNGKCYPVCFDLEGQILNGLNNAKSLRLNVTSSAGGQIKFIVERRTPDYR